MGSLRNMFICMIFMLPLFLYGQQNEEAIKKIERQVAEFKTENDSCMKKIENQLEEILVKIRKAEKEDQMKRLLEQAEKLSQKKKQEGLVAEKKFHSGLRQQSALNPNISLGGDFYGVYGSSSSDYNRLPSETSFGSGRFFLREMELGLQSALDPFSRGKVFFSFGREGVSLEEGYIQLLNCPLSMNLKMGEYKTQFGKLNRYHDHALPQFDRPRVLVNYFGNTSLKGFGIAANFLLPSIIATVNELDLEVIGGGVDQSFTSEGKHNLVYVAHLKNYYDLNRNTYFEIGFSGALGNNDPEEKRWTTIGGVDLTLKWTPAGRAKYRGIEWRTEFLYSHREDSVANINSWGFFSSFQIRLDARILASCRIDYSQLPTDNHLEEKGVSIAFDYWQSEFVFVRLQYNYIDRNFDEHDHKFIF